MLLNLYDSAYGDHKHCRKILGRALNSVTDWPEYIVDAYIMYEREEGEKLYLLNFNLKIVIVVFSEWLSPLSLLLKTQLCDRLPSIHRGYL